MKWLLRRFKYVCELEKQVSQPIIIKPDTIADPDEYVPRSQYNDLGLKAADLKLERDAAIKREETLRAAYENLEYRLSGIEGMDDVKKDRVLVTLQQDLEKSINYLKRYAYALGIQRGGILWDELQGLLTKYNMREYIPPTGYSYEELIAPTIRPVIEGTPTKKELDSGD
jgi:hypothetical protein